MTVLENYQNLLEAVEGSSAENKEILTNFITSQINNENKRKERLSEKRNLKREELNTFIETIYDILDTENYLTCRQIFKKLNDESIPKGKISYALSSLVRSKRAEKRTNTEEMILNKKYRATGYKKIK